MSRSDVSRMQLSSYRFPDELRVDELLVRIPVEDDIEEIAPAFLDPEVGGEAGLPPVGPDMLRAFLREQLPALKSQGLMSPYVIVEAENGTILGGAALHHFDPMRDVVEVGYWLLRPARGHGVATRVVRAFVDHALANGILRIEAHVRVGNAPSERVLERVGFAREGVKRALLRQGDSRVDATLFSYLAP
jgi:RimJ/RimL family protein N-acetyltransferase